MAPVSGTELVERAKSLARSKKLSKDYVSAEVGCSLDDGTVILILDLLD